MQQARSDIRAGNVLRERDELLLRAVYDLHFATAEQLCRLYFSPASLSHVREILKGLSDAGYLHRLKMPSSQDGVKPWVYTLGSAGIRYLKAAGLSEFLRFRATEHEEHSYLFLAHTLGLNEILIRVCLTNRSVRGRHPGEMACVSELRFSHVAMLDELSDEG